MRKTQTWMQFNMKLNQWSNQHIKLSKSSFNKNFKHMDLPKETHTHTLKKSNQFYISKTKFRQFSEHTLTHVNLCWPNHIVSAHVSRIVKNIACCVWKTSQDCISVFMLWRFEIWENHFNLHTIITAWWGLSPSRYIL